MHFSFQIQLSQCGFPARAFIFLHIYLAHVPQIRTRFPSLCIFVNVFKCIVELVLSVHRNCTHPPALFSCNAVPCTAVPTLNHRCEGLVRSRSGREVCGVRQNSPVSCFMQYESSQNIGNLERKTKERDIAENWSFPMDDSRPSTKSQPLSHNVQTFKISSLTTACREIILLQYCLTNESSIFHVIFKTSDM